MKILKESSELYKGIFWILDIEDPESSKDYFFTIPSDLNGNPKADGYNLNSKNGLTYNHEKVWKIINNKITKNYPYNYFPRGRVEISNSKATIYCSPYIASDDSIIAFIKKQFNLNSHNKIIKIKIIADGSEHYKCYLDD